MQPLLLEADRQLSHTQSVVFCASYVVQAFVKPYPTEEMSDDFHTSPPLYPSSGLAKNNDSMLVDWFGSRPAARCLCRKDLLLVTSEKLGWDYVGSRRMQNSCYFCIPRLQWKLPKHFQQLCRFNKYSIFCSHFRYVS